MIAHAFGKVCTNCGASTLELVEGPNDQGAFSCPHVLSRLSGDVGILNISSIDLEVVQGCYYKRKPNRFAGHNASIGDSGWGLGHMATSNKSCLLSKVFHFYAKKHVATIFLVANGVGVRGVKDFESDACVLQFFGNSTGP